MIKDDILHKKIGFISLGCDKNRVELEKMIYRIKSVGFEIVNNPSIANIIIINTCSFLESSRLESINNILEMSEYKSNNLEKIIVTGCLNGIEYSDIKESLPEVDAFVKISDNVNIVNIIYNLYNVYNDNLVSKEGRVLTTPNHYAYLKIADGCDNFCSYCLIPFIRGRYKSVPIDDVLNEANNLVNMGVKELILVAQDITKYGIDLYGKKSLVSLIKKLSEIDKLLYIRLLYCYPEELDDDLILEIKNNPKVLKYIDIPLQHTSNKILKAMNRKSTRESLDLLFKKLRFEIPNIVIRTTFILGFPGETEEDFEDLLNFIRNYKINNVGFFKFSREEGTLAYSMDNQVPENIKEIRYQKAYNLQYEIQNKLLNDLIGKKLGVIIDDTIDGYSVGRYYGQCPTIDSNIYINDTLIKGQIYNVKVIGKSGYDLKGELTYDEYTK